MNGNGSAPKPAWLENRSDPRVAADLRVELFASDFSSRLPAQTRDVSAGGVCVATPSPFACQSIRSITLQVPGRPLRLKASGRWQVTHRASATVLTGIAFEDIGMEMQDVLWDYVVDVSKDIARFIYRRSALRAIGIEGAMGIAHSSRLRIMRAGDQIYGEAAATQGANSIFLVQSGSVALQMRVRGVRNQAFAVAEAGALFGGLSMLTSVQDQEFAFARSDVRLLEVDERAFDHLSRSRPGLAQQISLAVTSAYSERFRTAMEIRRD